MNSIYKILSELKINYKEYKHRAVFTVAEAEKLDRGIPGGQSKNLFLRNKKGGKHYLVILPAQKKIDLKLLTSTLGEDKLSFASEERLLKYLGLTPGSVSPFGLINDKEHEVIVIVDNELLKNEKIGFHPNINTATVVIETEDFKKFLAWAGNKIKYLILE